MQSFQQNYSDDEGSVSILLMDENDDFLNLARVKNYTPKRNDGTKMILKRADFGDGVITVLKKRERQSYGRIRLL